MVFPNQLRLNRSPETAVFHGISRYFWGTPLNTHFQLEGALIIKPFDRVVYNYISTYTVYVCIILTIYLSLYHMSNDCTSY